MRRLPIRVRLTAWYAVLLAAIIVALGTFLVLQLQSDLEESVDREVQSGARHISFGYQTEGAEDFLDVSRTVLPRAGSAAQVLDPTGRVLLVYGETIARRPLISSQVRDDVLTGNRRLLTVQPPGDD